ncbi:TonB-dependent receptor [Bacteroides pyogenes]|uniref:TonB-dependent receptor n=1 Tax=Bacteroides pyogenes TaxID=310300 RepID=UPI0004860ECA|nr:TonB-dependent receptor [Bacteroides pyogenes]MBR8704761.1 Vitamin B12 transporter BtuB [Bacteroides pyogenes]MCI7070660.1 TonB-dependent receptor [Bacteroides pyogenes]MDY5354029.1 TonB-dependent receptor [Bacteroides pyogenes]TYK38378.1 TonB-dependent receptor [Bacteroides pyogenes]
MKKYIMILVSLCCALTQAMANHPEYPELKKSDANIVGHVLDKNTKEHLPYITVTLKGTTIGTVTDATGHYFLKNLPEGNFVLEVSSIGYKTVTRNVTLKKGKTLEEDFEIEEDAVALDGVVVSANRNETKRRLAPTLVNVLDMKLFERTQSTDLAQGLKFQPGVRVETNCQNCGFSQVRINGLDGPYSQILIDSRPVFSALAGVYGLEQIPANMIERVEVMRGGGSALFGSSAIAGTINIITKEPLSNSASISHELRGLGGLNTFENTTNFNGSILTDNNRMGITLFGQARHRSGYDRDGDGYTEMPVLDGRTLGFRAFIKPTDYSKVTAEFHNTHEFRRGGDLLKNEPHNAHIAEQLEHTNNIGSLNYSLMSPDGKHHFNAYASFMKVNRKSYYGGSDKLASDIIDGGRKNVEAAKDKFIADLKKKTPDISEDDILKKVEEEFNPQIHNGLTNEDWLELDKRMASYGRTDGLTYMLGAQYSYDFSKLLFMPSQLTVGGEYTRDKLDDISGYRPAPITQKVHVKSLFAQNEWKNDWLSLLVGARFDKHSMIKHVIVSPRANLRFNPVKDLSLRVSYSKGFRAPQIFDEDLHVDNAGGELILSVLDPNLKEETSHSFSGSVDWYHRFGAWQLNLMAEGFYTKLNDAFGSLQQNAVENGKAFIRKYRTNTDGAKVYGANLEGKLAYLSLAQFQAGVTVQKSLWDTKRQWNDDDAYTTRRMYRTPNVYSYFVATVNPVKRFSVSLSGNYTGNMLVGHEIPTEDDGSLTMFDGKPAATIHADRLQHGKDQTATTYGPRTFKTPSFFEMGCKLAYDFPLYKVYTLQAYAGVQNMFNSYQKDFDKGPSRDSAYIYGPGAPRSFFAGVKISY